MEVSDQADDISEPGEDFDISLPAAHSYLASSADSTVSLRGRCVLEAGWRGLLTCSAHAGLVFPGQTVPLLLTDPEDATAARAVIASQERLLCLLQPDETGGEITGYGVVCEVLEMYESDSGTLTLKAQAIHRAKLAQKPFLKHLVNYFRMRKLEVIVLSEQTPGHPLRPLRRGLSPAAVLTPWPQFVYDIYSYSRFSEQLRAHFEGLGVSQLPTDAVSLSFYAAANLSLSGRARLALFKEDNALLRLHRAAGVARESRWGCAGCGRPVAGAALSLRMSSAGLCAHYSNPGGFLHDVVTVSAANNVRAQGRPSAEYSWFPGYRWTVINCAGCWAHLGWRFDAERKSLRPQKFYGLCRNNLIQIDREKERGECGDLS